MNSASTNETFVLFDATIVPLQAILAVRDGGVSARCLYTTWGDAAQTVAPWLLPDETEARSLAETMRASRRHAHGVTWLDAGADLDALVDHLQGLQHLYADGKRYFLRYADGRAFADTWAALQPEQMHAVLGPIREWDAWSFERCGFTAPPAADLPAAALPLRLNRNQWAALLRAQRDTQRGIEWMARHPSLAKRYSGAQLRALSWRTGDWLRQQGMLGEAVRDAVGIAALRSDGRVFESQAFADAVRQSTTARDCDALPSWRVEQAYV